MNQYEAVLAAAREAALSQFVSTAQSRNERRQAFEEEMQPVLRAEARRKGRNSARDDDDWESNRTA